MATKLLETREKHILLSYVNKNNFFEPNVFWHHVLGEKLISALHVT